MLRIPPGDQRGPRRRADRRRGVEAGTRHSVLGQPIDMRRLDDRIAPHQGLLTVQQLAITAQGPKVVFIRVDHDQIPGIHTGRFALLSSTQATARKTDEDGHSQPAQVADIPPLSEATAARSCDEARHGDRPLQFTPRLESMSKRKHVAGHNRHPPQRNSSHRLSHNYARSLRSIMFLIVLRR